MGSSNPARTPKLQLAAEQPTTECWIPPKKDTAHPRAKEKPQQDSRGDKIVFRIKLHTCQRHLGGSKIKPCVHQETPQRLSQICLWLFECPLQREGSAVACRRDRCSGCSRPGCGISPPGEGCHWPYHRAARTYTGQKKQTLGGHKQNLVQTGTQEKGAAITQETDPDLPVNVRESSTESWVGSGLLQGWGHWVCQCVYGIFWRRLPLSSFSSVQSLSHVWLFATPWTAAQQASLSITNSWSLLKLMSMELVKPSNHLILCHPLPLSIFPSIRVFSKESVLWIRWPKYWSFSFNVSPSKEDSRLISFRMDWLYLLEVQGTLKSLLQHYR